MAPVAMMAPCPGIRRGTLPTVPTVPGLVSEMVVPWKSSRRQLALAGARHDVVEGGEELVEAHGAGVLDAGHHQRAVAVLAGHVDGDADIDLAADQAMRLPVQFGVGVVDAGHLLRWP